MPLSNAVTERLIKTAVLHRKNSYFYKTLFGARVGDVMMSIIQTASDAGQNVLHYLVSRRFKDFFARGSSGQRGISGRHEYSFPHGDYVQGAGHFDFCPPENQQALSNPH